ncbi:MAG: hypothetical protein JWO38_2038 [Gemmataceae bacterium]|nr:hypothetical protein [Gemmataceae bacterium]
MKVRALIPLAAAAGLWLPAAASAQQPAQLPLSAATTNPNQQLADAVAARLRTTDIVSGADVSIVAQEGTVYLTGTVRDAAQKDRLVAEVKTVTGVVVVRDSVGTFATGVVRVQNPPIAAPVAPTLLGPIAPSGPYGNPVVEPAPVGAPGQISPDMQAPPLPPYAWPTYAPYNNASRIAYPEAYPYNAFPFIGPYYPFPKVPLGWRKVTLEWEDGHWFLGRNSAPHDYWRVRFW